MRPSEHDDPAPLLRIDVALEAGRAVVTCGGTLDISCARRFDGAVAGAFELADACEIRLGGLSFIDSTGVRCLFRARRMATDLGRQLVVAEDLHPSVLRVLDLTGLKDYIVTGSR